MKNILSYFVYFLLLFAVLFGSCSERKRTNIFDPGYPKATVDAGLTAIGNNSTIKLKWNNPDITAIKATKIYRQLDKTVPHLIASAIPPSQTVYTDTSVHDGPDYFYYLTFTGANGPSPPSKTVRATTGPGSIWVLDIYSYEIQHFSYDLQQRDLRIVGIWQPEAMAFDNDNQIGLVTYPIFKTYELLDLNTGRSLASSSQKGAPMDAVYNPDRNVFWLIDSTSGLYEISENDINGSKRDIALDHPQQIVKVDQDFFILQSAGRNILRLNAKGVVLDSISQKPQGNAYENITLMRAVPADKALFFLNNYQGTGSLFRYNLLDGSIKTVYTDTTIYSFDVDGKQSSIWIIKPGKLNSSLLQLSMNGLRLQDQDGFIRPTDLRINTHNGNILITDIGSGKIYHYRSDLSLIGSFQSNGQPYKVYIE